MPDPHLTYLATTTKWNFNWSLWGVSHLGQAYLLDCNQIQSHVAGNNWWWLLDMLRYEIRFISHKLHSLMTSDADNIWREEMVFINVLTQLNRVTNSILENKWKFLICLQCSISDNFSRIWNSFTLWIFLRSLEKRFLFTMISCCFLF